MKTKISEINRILKTEDYTIFKQDGLLRFSQEKLKVMIGEIALKNLSPDLPIIVDVNYNILDGRYRFEALKTLSLPINYKVAEVATKIDLLKAKEVSFKPTPYDFLLSHQDKLAYRKLLEWSKLLPYGFQEIGASVFGELTAFKKNNVRDPFYNRFMNGEIEWDARHDYFLNQVQLSLAAIKKDIADEHLPLEFFERIFPLPIFSYKHELLLDFIKSLPHLDKWIEFSNSANPNSPTLEEFITESVRLYSENDLPNDVTKTYESKSYGSTWVSHFYYGLYCLNTFYGMKTENWPASIPNADVVYQVFRSKDYVRFSSYLK